MSLNFFILRHVQIISRQKRRLQKSYKVNFIGPPCSRTYMHSVMFNHADAFIALLGGLGSLEEIFHISSWTQLNIHQKPIGLLNINGFYNTLLSFLDHAVEQQFLTFSARQILISAATAEQLIDELQSFIPVVDSSMSRLNWSITERRKKLRLDLSLRL